MNPGAYTALEVSDTCVTLYRHAGSGAFETEARPFRPFLVSAAPLDPSVELAGSLPLRFLTEFASVSAYKEALEELKKEKTPYYTCRDMTQMVLSSLQLRLFTGMEFPELRRMQIAVRGTETLEAVECCDSDGGSRVLTGSEPEILSALNDAIIQYDPDVLEAHNLCREVMPFLLRRAKAHEFTFRCGRDQGGFSRRSSRFALAEKQIFYDRYSLAGRHLADTMHLALFYDAAHRDFEAFDLAYLKEYFSLSGENQAELTRSLSTLLSPSYFYRARFLPLGYQDILLRGNGSALDALFAAEYLAQKHSLPLPEAPRPFAGALTRADAQGVFLHVRHCDVRSLYPSVLLSENRAPARDELGIFLKLLAELRRFRLEVKDKRNAAPAEEKPHYEALQSSCKILINSFYGYLGFAQGMFNDYDLAGRVTARGRELLQKLIAFLNDAGVKVIELDTDGIYFQEPETRHEEFEKQLAGVLPTGIELDFDADYPAMFCYKSKNYALLSETDEIHLTGAALKSRALEGFLRQYIYAVADALLHNDPQRAETCYNALHDAIENRTIPLADLAKSEALNDSVANYRKKLDAGIGRRSAAYEVAESSGKTFRTGDTVRFYVTGDKAKLPVAGNARLLDPAETERLENVPYYLAKLEELQKNFAPFFTGGKA